MASISAPWPAAVAVSGGGDSIALMHLLSRWAGRSAQPRPVVLTVDHKLRRGSGTNARTVIRTAESLGLEAHVLYWIGSKPQGNVEAAAREARYRLLGKWCLEHKCSAVFVAHTLDDQAETFLLRLARGTGLDGLSAMAPVSRWPVEGYPGLSVIRPLLGTERDELRQYLTDVGGSWIEDPMNADSRFARSRIRSAWPTFQDVGLTKMRLAETAVHLGRARAALDSATSNFRARFTHRCEGGYAVDGVALSAVPREIGLRALAELLMEIGGEIYRPRFKRLESLFDALISGKRLPGRTLHGCRVGHLSRKRAPFGQSTIVIRPERSG
jgi:tRNA(Ile)-lysidine synthase